MSMTHLGQTFDIHTGGVDLIFPHHEDEIAQSEAATGKEFVRTWLHCAFLQMAGRKMAKSAGNIARVDELLERGTPPRALRYALISVHYRMALAFSDESLAAAASAVERLDNVLAALDSYSEEREDDPSLDDVLANGRRSFEEALDDDLNVSGGLAAVFEVVRELNRRIGARSLSTADARRAADFLLDLDRVLGVMSAPTRKLESDVADLLEQRAAARAARDWAASDRLRGVLADHGIAVEDTRDGQRWRRVGEPSRA